MRRVAIHLGPMHGPPRPPRLPQTVHAQHIGDPGGAADSPQAGQTDREGGAVVLPVRWVTRPPCGPTALDDVGQPGGFMVRVDGGDCPA